MVSLIPNAPTAAATGRAGQRNAGYGRDGPYGGEGGGGGFNAPAQALAPPSEEAVETLMVRHLYIHPCSYNRLVVSSHIIPYPPWFISSLPAQMSFNFYLLCYISLL